MSSRPLPFIATCKLQTQQFEVDKILLHFSHLILIQFANEEKTYLNAS